MSCKFTKHAHLNKLKDNHESLGNSGGAVENLLLVQSSILVFVEVRESLFLSLP